LGGEVVVCRGLNSS